MRQAAITCDRCGHREVVDANSSVQGWRLIMSAEGTVAADLCPACDTALMDGFLTDKPA